MKRAFRIEAIHPSYAVELAERQQTIEKKMLDDDGSGREERDDANYTVNDGIGVYKIDGPLLSSGNFWTRWLGYADYESVRNDLLAMANDPEVKDILVMMASPGGSVFGVSNASEAFAKVGAIKPITVYTEKNCCSGAYWLAANAKEIVVAPEAEVGSIGVIVTHVSYEKMLEEDGIKVTVIKSDELKAVGGPYTDLTEKEVAHIQAQVDQYADLFHDHIQAARPQVRLSGMKGQTFIGAEAVRMGLADAVMSYDAVINHIKTQRKPTQTGGYNMKMTAEQLRAALDAGKTLADIGLTEEERDEILATATTPPAEGAEGAEGKGSSTEGEGEGAEPEMVGMPVAEFEAMQAEMTAMAGKIEAAEAKAAAAVETSEKMRGIVTEVFNNRRLALGLTKIDVSKVSLDTLLADFAATTEQFNSSFKIGGSIKPPEKVEPKSIITDSVHAGLLQAAP